MLSHVECHPNRIRPSFASYYAHLHSIKRRPLISAWRSHLGLRYGASGTRDGDGNVREAASVDHGAVNAVGFSAELRVCVNKECERCHWLCFEMASCPLLPDLVCVCVCVCWEWINVRLFIRLSRQLVFQFVIRDLFKDYDNEKYFRVTASLFYTIWIRCGLRGRNAYL